jgi:hypothetical protein
MLFSTINMVRAATIMLVSGKCLIILHTSTCICCHTNIVFIHFSSILLRFEQTMFTGLRLIPSITTYMNHYFCGLCKIFILCRISLSLLYMYVHSQKKIKMGFFYSANNTQRERSYT